MHLLRSPSAPAAVFHRCWCHDVTMQNSSSCWHAIVAADGMFQLLRLRVSSAALAGLHRPSM